MIKRLLETSEKVQIVKVAQDSDVSLLFSKLTAGLDKHFLVLTIDAQSFKNQHKEETFLDWVAGELMNLSAQHQDRYDQPYLLIVTRAHLLSSQIVSELKAMKEQKERGQFQLLFHLPETQDIDAFFKADADLLSSCEYHEHLIPALEKEKKQGFSLKALAVCTLLSLIILTPLYFYYPSAQVIAPVMRQDPAELFTDNSLGNWSEESEEKLEKLQETIEQAP